MKILIIKLRNIGDTLLITPLFKNLKAHFGETSILDVLVNDGTEGILSHQNIRKIYTLKRQTKKFQKLQDEINLLKAIRSEKYDMVIGLTNGQRSAFLSFISGAKTRVGFPPKTFWAKYFYTHNLKEKHQHTIEN
ncbi:MAG: glycosyltransferase family 9 protein, partial [Helicobacter sp.]|nr:glycosyltransferase family 9 protein [Helicobacter sp.]